MKFGDYEPALMVGGPANGEIRPLSSGAMFMTYGLQRCVWGCQATCDDNIDRLPSLHRYEPVGRMNQAGLWLYVYQGVWE